MLVSSNISCDLVSHFTLQWRHNDHYGTLSDQPRDFFTQPFIQVYIKENIKALRHWPLCVEFTDNQWFPVQRASNAENVSIWWRHHELRQSPKGYGIADNNENMLIFYC